MTKDEMQRRKEELKYTITVPEVLSKYGVKVKRDRCIPFCHDSKSYNAKVSNGLYYCFVCNKSMDIYDITMHFNHCDFSTAFDILGGNEKPSFSSEIKARQARIRREKEIALKLKIQRQTREVVAVMAALRNIINESDPFSDDWCWAQNKLSYQLQLLEHYEGVERGAN